MVKDRFGQTVHIRELNIGNYPYADLMKRFGHELRRVDSAGGANQSQGQGRCLDRTTGTL